MQVYEMSWREFQLRLMGYKRHELNEWAKVREVAYCSLMGSHANPKKLPKTKEQFMPLDIDKPNKPKVAQWRKEQFLEAYKKWQNERQVKIHNRG
jgi:hypothetical protein